MLNKNEKYNCRKGNLSNSHKIIFGIKDIEFFFGIDTDKGSDHGLSSPYPSFALTLIS